MIRKPFLRGSAGAGTRWILALAVLLAVSAGASCAKRVKPDVSGVAVPAVSHEELQRQYEASIRASAVYDAAAQYPLTAVEGNKVVAVAWTSFGYQLGSQKLPDRTQVPPLGVWVFVTLAPQVQEVCRRIERRHLDLRLLQLLGLPLPQPGAKPRQFVEMEVDAQDLVRPCANPDPRTSEPCAPQIPKSGVDDFYLAFLANQMLGSWQENGYPFTRQGYTYDWNPDTPRFGFSEFVVRPGSQVNVVRIVPTDRYCSPETAPEP